MNKFITPDSSSTSQSKINRKEIKDKQRKATNHSRECRGEGQYQRGQPFYRLPKQMQRELCLHVGEQGGNACSCWHTLRCNALRSSQRSSLMWLQPSCSARRAVPGSPQQIRKTVHGPRSIPRHRGRQYRCRSCRLYCRAGQRFSREMQ